MFLTFNFILLFSSRVDHFTSYAFLPFRNHFLIPSTNSPPSSHLSLLLIAFHLTSPPPPIPLTLLSFPILPSAFPPILRLSPIVPRPHVLLGAPPDPRLYAYHTFHFSFRTTVTAASLPNASKALELRNAMKRNSWTLVRKRSWITAVRKKSLDHTLSMALYMALFIAGRAAS